MAQHTSGSGQAQTAPAPAGYAHAAYAASLSEFGTPRQLPLSGGWILQRAIPGSRYHDAMGCYPVFACRDWSALAHDLEALGDDLVSLTVVPDVFGAYDESLLQRAFPDLVAPFKNHCVVAVDPFAEHLVSRHHRKYARQALKRLSVDAHPDPPAFLDEWMTLHAALVDRHGVKGIKAFSRVSFAAQLQTPGIVVLRARDGDTTVGAQLWFVQSDVAYGHVLAFSADGYRLGAGYALYWKAFEYFSNRVRWCSIGGLPGRDGAEHDGLAWFKRGWSVDTRRAYICGRILNRARYVELAGRRLNTATSYFPAYRDGELV